MSTKDKLYNNIQCSNCAVSLDKASCKLCSRCMLATYCGKECQVAHWKNDHKQYCIEKKDRIVSKSNEKFEKSNHECPICLDDIAKLNECSIRSNCKCNTKCKLECGHEFHTQCIKKIKKISNQCPLCRLDLSLNMFSIINKIKEIHYNHTDEQQDKLLLDKLFMQLNEFVIRSNTTAQQVIGSFYIEGIGIKQDYCLAFKYTSMAASKNNHNALCNLGMMYEYGNYVKQDYKLAYDYYKQSAEQKNLTAQYKLAGLYFNGLGVEQDYAKSIEYLMLSVEQDYMFAQYKIGELYEYGRFVEQNNEKAIKYYKLASEQDYKPAIDKLNKLMPK